MLDDSTLSPAAARWRRLVQSLEQQFHLVDESIDVGPNVVRMLHPRSADELIDEDDFQVDERLPYWAEIWPSARVLARHIATLEGQGRTLLELGCAVGLVTTVAVSRGFQTLATDYYGEALNFAQVNAVRNGLLPPETRLLDWRRWPDELPRFDVVAAADVIYEKDYPALVAEAFLRALTPQGLGLFTDPGRKNQPAFVHECRQRGLTVTCAAHVPCEHLGQSVTVQLYEIRRG